MVHNPQRRSWAIHVADGPEMKKQGSGSMNHFPQHQAGFSDQNNKEVAE
jgi:hypothetical protein